MSLLLTATAALLCFKELVFDRQYSFVTQGGAVAVHLLECHLGLLFPE